MYVRGVADPEITACAAAIKAKGGKLPLVGRFTETALQPNGASAPAWRCYSPDAVDPTTGEYRQGSGNTNYCGQVSMIGAVQEAIFECDGCNAYLRLYSTGKASVSTTRTEH